MTTGAGQSRFIVGIDLGTTNSVCAYVDTQSHEPARFHEITQRISPEDWQARITLPSFLYLPGPHELPPGSLSLPWGVPEYVAGEFARNQGARVPGRLVSSAKSWLCHSGVERTAPILPWDALPDVDKISPVEASARYLSHLRDSWNHEMPEPLELQELILTVPASFNEVARELTVAAAHKAGLTRLRLLEEPQAAFYSWLFQREKTWKHDLADVRLILICDVGGGTSDFTLIRVRDDLTLERVAVGEHLMLGGDNMDLALAHHMEAVIAAGDDNSQQSGVRLDSRQWGVLVQECRSAKERLLGDNPPEKVTITIPGSGAQLFAGLLQGELTREEAERLVLDGFFPGVDRNEMPYRGRRSGLSEWGLPYVADPAVPRHLAEFLAHHQSETPNAVLFNGAALTPAPVQWRMVELLQYWSGEACTVLPNPWLDRAVAHGAACYGMVLRGGGVRIGGGTGRSYYVKVENEAQETVGVCLVSAQMGEGDETTIEQPELKLRVGHPVSFPLVCANNRPQDRPGDVVTTEPEDAFDTLPPVRTVLQSKRAEDGELPVRMKARVSEIGTLELWCVSRQSDEQWRLQFDLRGEPLPPMESIVSRDTMAGARELVVKTFRTKPAKLAADAVRPRTVLAALEELLKMRREEWPTPVLREIWEALDRVKARRRSQDQYEAAWFNAVGWCMRPGFGYALDEWRMDRVWDVFPQWLQWHKETATRLEWWVMWRRVAGGLSVERQERLFADIAPALLPGRKHIKTFSRPAATQAEQVEILRLAASLEKVNAAEKTQLGELVLDRVTRRGSGSANDLWALARIGARAPFAASPHLALPPATVGPWVEALLDTTWKDGAVFAVSQMARFTGDRTRDLDDPLRQRVAERLIQENASPEMVRSTLEVVALEAAEQVQILGDTLPVGLRLSR
ncbi:MAG: Hsp70 family protein [Candidatus Xenobia bacterium]